MNKVQRRWCKLIGIGVAVILLLLAVILMAVLIPRIEEDTELPSRSTDASGRTGEDDNTTNLQTTFSSSTQSHTRPLNPHPSVTTALPSYVPVVSGSVRIVVTGVANYPSEMIGVDVENEIQWILFSGSNYDVYIIQRFSDYSQVIVGMSINRDTDGDLSFNRSVIFCTEIPLYDQYIAPEHISKAIVQGANQVFKGQMNITVTSLTEPITVPDVIVPLQYGKCSDLPGYILIGESVGANTDTLCSETSGGSSIAVRDSCQDPNSEEDICPCLEQCELCENNGRPVNIAQPHHCNCGASLQHSLTTINCTLQQNNAICSDHFRGKLRDYFSTPCSCRYRLRYVYPCLDTVQCATPDVCDDKLDWCMSGYSISGIASDGAKCATRDEDCGL